jgi:hypothetical protein
MNKCERENKAWSMVMCVATTKLSANLKQEGRIINFMNKCERDNKAWSCVLQLRILKLSANLSNKNGPKRIIISLCLFFHLCLVMCYHISG